MQKIPFKGPKSVLENTVKATREADEMDVVETRRMRKIVDDEKLKKSYHDTVVRKERLRDMKLSEEDTFENDPADIMRSRRIYRALAREPIPFINSLMSELVCFTPKMVYLIAAPTGGGKSTIVGNIIAGMIPHLAKGVTDINSEVRHNGKVLVISNEEDKDDVFTRVACILLGLSFAKDKKVSYDPIITQQIEDKIVELMAYIDVVGKDYKASSTTSEYTQTVEGVMEVLDRARDRRYGAILIDYYQNIRASIMDSRPEAHVHQEEFVDRLNRFKDTFLTGPVVIMSQVGPQTKKGDATLWDRMQGRKTILNVAPMHIEAYPIKAKQCTVFTVHKDRYWNNDGMKLTMGFDKKTSTFVEYSQAFQDTVASEQNDFAASKFKALEE